MLDYLGRVEPGICIERARYVTESYQQTTRLPEILRRAKALENTLAKMSLYILPGSLLVGNQASRPSSAPLFPEFTVDFLEREIFAKDPLSPADRPADRFVIDEATLPELKKILDWWKGHTGETVTSPRTTPGCLPTESEGYSSFAGRNWPDLTWRSRRPWRGSGSTRL